MNLIDLIEEKIRLSHERLANMGEQLETLERMRDDARSLDGGGSEEPSEAPTTGKRARRPILGPVTRQSGSAEEILKRAPGARRGQQKASRREVLLFVREGGQVTVPEVEARFGLSNKSARYHLHGLVASGELEAVGRRSRAILYAPKSTVPAAGSKARQPETLVGRVLACLSVPRTLAELVTVMDMRKNLSGVNEALQALVAQGEVERRDDGRYRKLGQ